MIIGIIFWSSLFIIIYTYIGYPLLISLLAQSKPKPDNTSEYFPMVTLIIAAYNEESVIEKKILNSLQLDYPRSKLQILITVDGEEDDTVNVVRKYLSNGIDLDFSKNRRGKVVALSNAIHISKGEVIVVSDANNMFEKDTLRNLISPLSDIKVGAVSGAKHIIKDGKSLSHSEGLYWKYESFVKMQETRFGNCTAASGEIIAFKKCLYTPPPSKKGFSDDFYIITSIMRKGFRVVYSSKAKSFETVSQSANDEILRRSRIIAQRCQAIINSATILPFNNIVTVWQIISHKYLRLLLPFFMIFALVTNFLALFVQHSDFIFPILVLKNPYAQYLFYLQISFYIIAFLGNNLSGTGLLFRILYIPAFLVNSNLATFNGVIYFLKGHKFDVWKKVARTD